MASIQELEHSLAELQQKIRQSEAKVEEYENMFKQAIKDGQAADIRADLRSLMENATQHLIAIRQEKQQVLECLLKLKSKSQLSDKQDNMMLITEKLLRHRLLDAPTTVTIRDERFKPKLIRFYECNAGQGMLRCMLLDIAMPSNVVIAAHLFRRANEDLSALMVGIEDIDDVRNGLLLFKPIEKAFDDRDLSFIYDSTKDKLKVKVFNPALLDRLLIDNLTDDQLASFHVSRHILRSLHKKDRPVFANGSEFNLLLKFSDIDGQALAFKNLNRPYLRCLNLQARLARMTAIERGWISKDWDFDDFYVEGVSADDKVKSLFESIDRAQSAGETMSAYKSDVVLSESQPIPDLDMSDIDD